MGSCTRSAHPIFLITKHQIGQSIQLLPDLVINQFCLRNNTADYLSLLNWSLMRAIYKVRLRILF